MEPPLSVDFDARYEVLSHLDVGARANPAA
jgi:hypothetical protein